MRNRSCKSNQRRRLIKNGHRKVNGRYRVYFRVVLATAQENEKTLGYH